MVNKDGEGGNKIRGETRRKEKARVLIDRINQHNDLARPAKEVGNHLGRDAVTWWCVGDEDMMEWSERKGDHIFDVAEYYGKEAAKGLSKLHRVIGFSDPMMYSWRRI